MRLSVRDAAALLNVSTKTIYRWLAEERLPGYRVNHRYRFDRAELIEWATAHRLGTPTVGGPLSADPAYPRFDLALIAGGVHFRVDGASRDEVLEHVVRLMPVVAEAERAAVVEALRSRENLATTAIGGGIALPHLRNPLRYQIERPAVALCFLDRPVPWGGLDGRPVGVVFAIVANTVGAVLRLHASTLFALQDPGFRERVLTQAPRQALHDEAARVADGFQALLAAPMALEARP
jgi:PTS system nitrogen regulatory IIA component